MKVSLVLAIFLLFLISFSSAVMSNSTYTCTVEKSLMCSINGCTDQEVNGHIIVDEARQTFSLGMEVTPITSSETLGIFRIFKSGNLSYTKIALSDVEIIGLKRGSFVSVKDLMLMSYVSYGVCDF
jgi:hypothetical protein